MFRLTYTLPTYGEAVDRNKVAVNKGCKCQGDTEGGNGGVSFSAGCSSGSGTKYCKWNKSEPEDINKFRLKRVEMPNDRKQKVINTLFKFYITKKKYKLIESIG